MNRISQNLDWSGPDVAIVHSRHNRRIVGCLALALIDLVTLAVGFLVPHFVYIGTMDNTHGVMMFLVLVPIYFGVASFSRTYATRTLESPALGISRSVKAFAFSAAALLLIAYTLKTGAEFSRAVFWSGVILSALLLITNRALAFRPLLSYLGGAASTTVVICDGVNYQPRDGEMLIRAGAIGFDPSTQDPYLFHRLAEIATRADRILVACPEERYAAWSIVLRGLAAQGELFSTQEDHLGIIGVGHHHGHRTMVVTTGAMGLADRMAKRILDLVLSSIALVIALPAMVVVAIAIKLESRGPILFIQDRVGRDNKLFPMYKFRSMYTELCDANASQLTTRNDRRVTRVGNFIRRTSIDELPQILNVIKGDMSIVGPRPHALSAKAADLLYWDVDHRYRHRHQMKPGITGLAQIRGFRGNTERVEDLTNRLDADLEYVAGWSIWRDFAIILRTFSVLRHGNAF